MPLPNAPSGAPRRTIAAAAAIVALGALAPAGVAAQQITRTPVEVTIPFPPTEVRALGRSHLVYEIHLTNFGPDTLHLRALATVDPDAGPTPIDATPGARLTPIFVGPPVPPGAGSLLLPSGRRAVLLRWVSLAAAARVPARLEHHFLFGSSDTLRMAAVAVKGGGGAEVSAPVTAGRWVAVRGPSNGSGHRTSLVALHGHVGVPQRFAVDWVALGDDGRFYSGDPAQNASWAGYRMPVVAVAAGVVVSTRDGLAENVPLTGAMAIPIDAASAAGNHVVVRMEDGNHALYGHLRPGSLKVAPGNTVARGDTLGEVGNSGNSLAPHLHFDITDRPVPLEGEGLPFRLDAFRLIGRIDSLDASLANHPWLPDLQRPARDVAGEIPLENMVVEVVPPPR